MVGRGGYRTQAQKDGRSAGQRQRRMARDRQRRNREANVYPISVRKSVVSDSRYDTGVGTFGLYKSDGEWHLTAMAVQRSREKMVSDRQGATKSEVVDRLLVTPVRSDFAEPEDGLHLSSFDKKKDAMKSINADKSTRVDTGRYLIRPQDWGRSMTTYKVDRDEYHDFSRKHCVTSVRK